MLTFHRAEGSYFVVPKIQGFFSVMQDSFDFITLIWYHEGERGRFATMVLGRIQTCDSMNAWYVSEWRMQGELCVMLKLVCYLFNSPVFSSHPQFRPALSGLKPAARRKTLV